MVETTNENVVGIYVAYASMLLDIDASSVTKEQRQKAKELLFKHNYMGYSAMFVPDLQLKLEKCKDQLAFRKANQRPAKKLEGMIEILEEIIEDFKEPKK